MSRDYIIKWPVPWLQQCGYAYFKTFSCELEKQLFRLRHSRYQGGIACMVD